ncbi:MAG: TIGR02221 family CRISPR-associated protein [Deferribacteraceae bacterium]|jgi:CRISPR-associated Csx2 family protein|nr:TIGR02221 family CRISPR-associated protein [Deferribacteraceae bacterium]
MAKHFISFLGIGIPEKGYKEVVYDNGEKTKFIQLHLIKEFCRDYTNDDRFTFFVTENARSTTWEPEDGLKYELAKLALKNLSNPIDITNIVDIGDGKTEKEIWGIFNKVYENIRDDDLIIFDVTHGFRSLPILAIVALNYARTLKKFTLNKLYYGALEPGTDYGSVIDLTNFDLIYRWSTAISDFNKYGTAGPIKDLLKNDAIDKVSKVLTTIRGQEIVSGKVFQKCKDYLVEYKYSRPYPPPFEPVFDLVETKLNAFKTDNPVGNIVASIDWYIKHQLIQQGITMLREGILTILISQAGCDYNDIELRDKCSTMIGHHNKERTNESERELEESLQEGLQKINSSAWYEDCAKIYQSIKDIRNTVNHGGFTPKTTGGKKSMFFNAEEIIGKLQASFGNLKNTLREHKLWGDDI